MRAARTLANLSLGAIGPVFLVLAGALVLTATAGCGFAAGATTRTPGSQGTLVRIVRPDGAVKEASMKDLDSLGKGRIFVDGSWEEGPTLPEVLQFADVTGFQHVTIIGSGSPPLTLSKEEVNSGVILNLTGQGTVKLSLPDIPRNEWIDDVNTIKAE